MDLIRSLFLLLFISTVIGYPEQGKWTRLTKHEGIEHIGLRKSLYKSSGVFIKIKCDSSGTDSKPDIHIHIGWMLLKMPCWNEYLSLDQNGTFYRQIYNQPKDIFPTGDGHELAYFKTPLLAYKCDHNIILPEMSVHDLISDSDAKAEAEQEAARSIMEQEKSLKRNDDIAFGLFTAKPTSTPSSMIVNTNHQVAVVPADGIYLLLIHTSSVNNENYSATIEVEMRSDHGYLSAADWPLYGFYGAMCVIYVVYGLAWMIISFMQWREMLRVQYWIGAVILLGNLEMAVFIAEYQSVNATGISVPGLIIFAELVSCAKRSLARMLVIIVALGFGIVKPRLGILLHRVVAIGIVYFILASIESCTRELQPRHSFEKETVLATLPLALLDSAVCLWIFSALVATTRTLKLRRNLVKLSLYRNFTIALTFAVLASAIFMIWSVKYHKMVMCLSDWKELWVDDAYWHLLFAIILLVIMILWRPTINNQRFAFSPLLDNGSDADDEEEGEKLMSEIHDTMKLRNTRMSSSSPRESRSMEDELKWVDENIPSSLADTALPVLDSDEEIVTTKFEISKMQ